MCVEGRLAFSTCKIEVMVVVVVSRWHAFYVGRFSIYFRFMYV